MFYAIRARKEINYAQIGEKLARVFPGHSSKYWEDKFFEFFVSSSFYEQDLVYSKQQAVEFVNNVVDTFIWNLEMEE